MVLVVLIGRMNGLMMIAAVSERVCMCVCVWVLVCVCINVHVRMRKWTCVYVC